MRARLTAAAFGILVGGGGLATVEAQMGPFDHWRGTVAGRVMALGNDRGLPVIVLDNDKAYRIRAELPTTISIGDRLWLHRDFVLKVRAAAPSDPGLAAARAKCRADWPADFVMQRFCIEQQEEAYRALGGRQ